MTKTLQIGDNAPWFDAVTLAGARINLGVKAGRWIALCFLGDLTDPTLVVTLAQLLGEAALFEDDQLNFFGVVTEPVDHAAALAAVSHKALGFMADFDHKITHLYGAMDHPQMIVLDPMLRVMVQFKLADSDPAMLRAFLRDLPKVDDFAGVALTAPALIVPRVFEPELCAELIAYYDGQGGVDSGFMLDEGGKTRTVIAHNLKSRKDVTVRDAVLRDAMRDRMARGLIPLIERFFHHRPTRMDRAIVSCYTADDGGHFARHRDNVNAAARHRRFAVSLNLNGGYEGCELIFPECGRRRYTAPVGGAIVFSTGALHEVLPITKGKRYAFVPFLYGEEESRQRLAGNADLHDGEFIYTGTDDQLFPAV